jgi:aminobenzoyl-glutamate transport protein
MVTLVPIFTLAGWWLTDRVVEPRLATQTLWLVPGVDSAGADAPAAPVSHRGLWLAGAAALLVVAAAVALAWAPGMPLRADDGSFEPLLHSIVALTFLLFLVSGLAYGVAASTIRSDRDAVAMMSAAMAQMGAYIVLAFFAAVFLALFTWSNLAIILAVNGADWLRGIGLIGLPLLLAIVVVATTINVVLGSASAKWAILAPVLVPMLMPLGVSPEWTQAAYRIGDSITNPITPLLPYFPLVLITARRYVPDAGIGTIVALMLPYSIAFGVLSTATLAVWWLTGLPPGPGQ